MCKSICLLISRQIFKVQSISLKAGSTPLPTTWAIETSRDIGNDFEAIYDYTFDRHEDHKNFIGDVRAHSIVFGYPCVFFLIVYLYPL